MKPPRIIYLNRDSAWLAVAAVVVAFAIGWVIGTLWVGA